LSANLDAFADQPFTVLVDDLLPARRRLGRPPRISDSELIGLAIAQVLLDCPQFANSAEEAEMPKWPVCRGRSNLQTLRAARG
jgi:hypothetical protein